LSLLQSVSSPADLRRLDRAELAELAQQIRDFLVRKVSATGGHLGPNLGVVELTLALHRVFESPSDAVIFDTGHQAYVHKIVTGRQAGFDTLRKQGGLSGYPSRAESEHDWVESSHASAALSYADGLAKAFALRGQRRHVVAVVGDGALTGGMCWEALNNIAAGKNRSVIIVVNDNGRSYSPTIGGLADHLSALRLQPRYEQVLARGRDTVQRLPLVGASLFTMLHGLKVGLKDAMTPQVMFSDLGIKYLGPVDGHDLAAMEAALRRAKAFGGPVIVHAVTRKGMGYAPAENDEADQMHSTGVIDPGTGAALAASLPSWTSVFSSELVALGDRRADLVAITAAMPGPTGLAAFAEAYPRRFFDVGIAEQHAMTSAAGLALGGMHPVVALYATFLNRAFDQLLMDVALLRQPVTVVLDRAGITGPDGASHHGVWDLSLLGIVPGIRVAAPRDAATLRAELGEAVAVDDGPTVLRFPTGAVVDEVPALQRLPGGADLLRRPSEGEASDVLLIAVGVLAGLALATAQRLAQQGIGVTVLDPRWVLPVGADVLELARTHRLVLTLEDGGTHGGIGSAVSAVLRSAEIDVVCRDLGVPQRFLEHASRVELLDRLGLTAQDLARRITGWVAAMATDDPGPAPRATERAMPVTDPDLR
jgi:1-deoxy-D-xylulose-5-phosphate synthase